MKKPCPDRDATYMPSDHAWIMGLSFAPFMLLPFFVLADRARHGDPTLLGVGLASALLGVTLLFLAKLPLYRQRVFCSFGPKRLSPRHRRLYRSAYAAIAVSVLSLGGVTATLTPSPI